MAPNPDVWLSPQGWRRESGPWLFRVVFGSHARGHLNGVEGVQEGSRATHADRGEAASAEGMAAMGTSGSGARLEAVAVFLHAASRRRARHFNSAVMTDAAMDIMLSIFVAQVHGRPIGRSALAMAIVLTMERIHALIEELVQANLIVRAEPLKPVVMTERGARLMHSYLETQKIAA